MPEQLELTLDEYHNLPRGKVSRPAGRKPGISPEHLIQNSILTYLAMLDRVYAVRTNSGKIKNEEGRLITLAPAGTSDITGYISVQTSIGKIAVAMAIEVKAGPKNQPTDLQQSYLDGVTRAGGFAMVAHSVVEVQQAIEAFVMKMEVR
jgi:hypothetical protein